MGADLQVTVWLQLTRGTQVVIGFIDLYIGIVLDTTPDTDGIGLGAMMVAVLFGYLLRLGLIFLAVYLVKDAGWISRPALGSSIIVTHLGLLLWELKYLSLSLAYPGLKPASRH